MSSNFDIVSYVNSLPNDVFRINVSFKNITFIPDLTRFTNLRELSCSHNNLKHLPKLPDSIILLNCGNNELKSLPSVLPSKLKYLLCNNNKLTHLPTLPNTLINIYCINNWLSKLPTLPINLTQLYCSRNFISKLPDLPPNLIELSCENNIIKNIDALPDSLESLYIKNNKLTRLPQFPYSLNNIEIDDYLLKLYDINLVMDSEHVVNNHITTINKFREFYFTSKFRKQFLKWMEPIVQKKYHPTNLIKLLANCNWENEIETTRLLESW